jgi:hypothetical protein
VLVDSMAVAEMKFSIITDPTGATLDQATTRK